MLYADSVTCDSTVPALEDIAFTLEMFNPDSEGKPTNHRGCDETGKASCGQYNGRMAHLH